MKSIQKALIIIFTTVIVSCSVLKLSEPTDVELQKAQKIWSDITLPDLQEGFSIYKKKCGSCHYLYRPEQFNTEKWNKSLDLMKTKSNLTDFEYEKIRKYILSKCND